MSGVVRSRSSVSLGWIPAVVAVGAAVALAASASVGGATASAGATPCQVLKRHHRPLPARCKPNAAPQLPSLGSIIATIPIPGESGEHGDIAFGDGSLWVADLKGLARIDPATNTVVARIATPPWDGGLVVSDGAVFEVNFDQDLLTRIDPATDTVTATIHLAPGSAPEGITATPGSIWIANHHGQSVLRVDTATNTITASIPSGRPPGSTDGPQFLTAGFGSIWAAVIATNTIERIDVTTNAIVARIPESGICGYLAASATSVWVTNGGCSGDAFSRLDPATNTVVSLTPEFAALRAAGHPAKTASGITIVDGSVYIALAQPSPALIRISEATDTVTGYLALPGFPNADQSGFTGVEYGAGSLWVRGYGEVVRIQPNT
jgi:hypothetical protein